MNTAPDSHSCIHRLSRRPHVVTLPCAFVGVLALWVASAFGHEFWIEPVMHPGQQLELQAFVGHGLDGTAVSLRASTSYPVLLNRHCRVPVPAQQHSAQVQAHARDMLAASAQNSATTACLPVKAGLNTISFTSAPALHRYQSIEEFAQFTREQGLDWALQQHQARSLPDTPFSEQFIRHTQSLFCAGQADDGVLAFAFGGKALQKYAWQATHPGGDTAGGGLDELHVKLWLDDMPPAVREVHVFRLDHHGRRSMTRRYTDTHGGLLLDTASASVVMINTTLLKQPTTRSMLATGALWESHWVSLYIDVASCKNTLQQ